MWWSWGAGRDRGGGRGWGKEVGWGVAIYVSLISDFLFLISDGLS